MSGKEKLQDAIGMIGEDLIADAKQPARKKKRYSKVLQGLAAVAVIAVVAVSAVHIFQNISGNGDSDKGNSSDEIIKQDKVELSGGINTSGSNEILNAYAVSTPVYPVMQPYPDESGVTDNESYMEFEELYTQWSEARYKQKQAYRDMSIDLDSFILKSTQEFVGHSGSDNVIYSPLNVYMALGMLAELTDGNSRQQILDLLGTENIESLREEANAIWNAHYCNDGAVTSLLASSVWLNRDVSFKQETLDRLASNYYASSYQGEMGTDEFNKALQEWIGENTGGLLSEQAETLEMTPETVMSLATTVFYSAKWSDEFSEEKTDIQTFHGANGDVKCEFMNDRIESSYFWGEKFSAASKSLEESGNMYIILPDEGVSVDEVLADNEWLEFVNAGFLWENSKRMKINLSLPKFDVSSQFDLADGLKKLGVTDVFDTSVSDFSQMTDMTDIGLSEARHGVRVAIDEEGCTAAAFTAMIAEGSAMPPDDEIDFVVDRPFIFVITSEVGLPMFIGVVNNIS